MQNVEEPSGESGVKSTDVGKNNFLARKHRVDHSPSVSAGINPTSSRGGHIAILHLGDEGTYGHFNQNVVDEVGDKIDACLL